MTKETNSKKSYLELIAEMQDYRPKYRNMTSMSEINMIAKHFGLRQMTTYELQNLRDMVVLYSTVQEFEGTGFLEQMSGWQSITTVIDHIKSLKEQEA